MGGATREVQRNMRRYMSSVTITDPLVKYQSLLATGRCCPNPAQHRLAVHLQKVYHRLKDYSPSVEYHTRLRAITNALNNPKGGDQSQQLAAQNHPIRRNPLFARFFARTQGRDTLALARVLAGHEEAIHIDSPQGLFLSGEVGTGKSMLLDLLAEGLPTSRKRRWHFNIFMLKMHSELEYDGDRYSLLWMAREMIEKSPVLFLDEFQLPDRAASKILSNLFTAFFQLGGVLVASSNRMPEELQKAAGFEYVAPTASGLMGRALALGRARSKGELFGPSSDFAPFLEVLKARCELWQMEGAKDWRRRGSDRFPTDVRTNLAHNSVPQIQTEIDIEPLLSEKPEGSSGTATRPEEYYISGPDHEPLWNAALSRHRATSTPDTAWKATTIIVYGRRVTIPQQCNGVVVWNFQDLVSSFGPADYITMASTYHTFIIDNIPILVLQKKNEARRFITLLDALYEARCKLIVRAVVGPDDLFFPDAQPTTTPVPKTTGQQVDADAMHSETIAEAYQDQVSPFRPNISSYNPDLDPDSDVDVEPKRGLSKVDFSNTAAFTGEDERFAYKRAASRLWELCGEGWHARQGDWWQPLPIEARHWEGGPAMKPRPWSPGEKTSGDITMGPSVELDEPAGLQRLRLEHLRKKQGAVTRSQ
ncbi:AFG1-like ATPase-domain-containing protein [Xylaria acuta]|nr:AFG1-like ATPase-domain-containing protein [Xylaria acuta]